jgi:hypothetical protein
LELKKMLFDLVETVKSRPKRSILESRTFTKRGIALTSVGAIIDSRLGTLTQAKMGEVERIWIEDLSTPVRGDAGFLPPLQRLTNDDYERL